ncbi:MAG: MFS transporter [Pseudonocardiaceae bacterium]|nr:MFS transporter [Pseudonocardiaceae bacterium]
MSTEAAASGSSGSSDTQVDRRFFGHPKGLANLFGVEMWERFSFYGMQAILLYYLYFSVADGGLAISKPVAAGIVGAYGGTVYLATIAGSWVCDRLLGPERTLFYSGVLILFGHIALAVVPGVLGVGAGLVLVAIGSGGLKATATALVGYLYAEGDERRDAGFSIFYMGVNIGALVGPLITGFLQSHVGFHFGFGAAAVGMAAGLAQYAVSRKNLPDKGREVPNPLPPHGHVLATGLALAGATVIVLLVLGGWITAENLADVATWVIVAAAVVLFLAMVTNRKITAVERKRVYAMIPLCLVSFGFWALFQQQFTVLAIYAETRVNLNVFGWEIPPAWFESVEPLFVVLLAPAFAALWTKLATRQPSTPIKFSLGVGFMGGAFLIMALLGEIRGEDVVNPLLLVLVLVVFVVGELCLSPVGLSVSTKLAPARYRAQMVALFFLSVAAGTAVAGKLAGHYEEFTASGDEPLYFGILGGIAVGLGVLSALISPFIRRLMSGVR